MTLKNLQLKGGIVSYDDFHEVDPYKNLEDQLLDEDLYQIKYLNEKYLVDIGWKEYYKAFQIVIIKQCQWDQRILTMHAKTLDDLVIKTQESIDYVIQIIGKNDPTNNALLQNVDLKGGTIVHSNFTNPDDKAQVIYKELQLSYLNNYYIIDVDWDVKLQKFTVMVLEKAKWLRPLLFKKTKDVSRLKKNLQECIDFVVNRIAHKNKDN